MTNTVAPDEIPRGLFGLKEKDIHNWVFLTAFAAGSQDPMTVEMTLDQWMVLPPVQYVVKLELSQQQPRRPSASSNDPAATLPVPRGHIEWKDGQNWVVLTAYRIETKEAVTVEMTLAQWFALKPVRAAVRDRLESWQDRKMPTW